MDVFWVCLKERESLLHITDPILLLLLLRNPWSPAGPSYQHHNTHTHTHTGPAVHTDGPHSLNLLLSTAEPAHQEPGCVWVCVHVCMCVREREVHRTTGPQFRQFPSTIVQSCSRNSASRLLPSGLQPLYSAPRCALLSPVFPFSRVSFMSLTSAGTRRSSRGSSSSSNRVSWTLSHPQTQPAGQEICFCPSWSKTKGHTQVKEHYDMNIESMFLSLSHCERLRNRI